MIVPSLMLVPELVVDEKVGDGTIVSGELDRGNDGEGKKEDVTL